MAQYSLPCLYTIAALPSGRGTMTWPMIFMWFLFHAVSIEGYDSNGFFFRNSWGTDWGKNGCGYLPFIDWSRVVEAG